MNDPILNDAIILAETLLDPNEWCWYDNGDYGDWKYHCHHCSGKSRKADYKNPRSVKHNIDCPVLVALDILTRIKE